MYDTDIYRDWQTYLVTNDANMIAKLIVFDHTIILYNVNSLQKFENVYLSQERELVTSLRVELAELQTDTEMVSTQWSQQNQFCRFYLNGNKKPTC